MKAIVQDRFGSCELREVDQPELTEDTVLVRVHASSVNAADWYEMAGRPYIGRLMGMGVRGPKSKSLGSDYAGRVEAIGSNVTEFQPGDELFGARNGAYAEYVTVAADRHVLKPANLSFEEAAAVPVAALTALQALRDKGQVQPGQHVLINGASGGVGTFAVQIAKALGAEVTGVCSTRNVEQARALGADHVVDYTREDFTKSERRYDLMIDIAGSQPFRKCRRVLVPGARIVVVGGSKGRVLGPLRHVLRMRLASIGRSQKVVFFIAKMKKDDMLVLREVLETGKVRSVIDRTYPLAEVPEALRHFDEEHARGKIVITV